MQNTAPRVGWEMSAIGGSSWPLATNVPVPTLPGAALVPVRKQSRLELSQLPAVPPQSASVTQPRCACPDATEHAVVTGPCVHSPSPSTGAVSTQSRVFTVPVSSRHADGFVGSPVFWQSPPLGHAVVLLHGAPELVAPMQRLPPQIVAPTAVQSELSSHGVAAALLQVSHRHRSPGSPLQTGLLAVTVLVTGSVALDTP